MLKQEMDPLTWTTWELRNTQEAATLRLQSVFCKCYSVDTAIFPRVQTEWKVVSHSCISITSVVQYQRGKQDQNYIWLHLYMYHIHASYSGGGSPVPISTKVTPTLMEVFPQSRQVTAGIVPSYVGYASSFFISNSPFVSVSSFPIRTYITHVTDTTSFKK
jgi:hypothetical protein